MLCVGMWGRTRSDGSGLREDCVRSFGRKRSIETKFPFFPSEAVSPSEKFFAFLETFWLFFFFNLCSRSNFF